MTHAALPTFRFSDGAFIAQAQPPQPQQVSLDSPALSVLTDLTEVRAATVSHRSSLAQAELKMIHQGVRLLFVVDEMPRVDGIVTAGDLHGEKPLRLIHQRNVKRAELCVADVMLRLAELDTVEFHSLGRATVGNVVATLLKFGRPHLLVCESTPPTGQARIRGLISLTQVERQLGVTLPSLAIASTFAEIEQTLA